MFRSIYDEKEAAIAQPMEPLAVGAYAPNIPLATTQQGTVSSAELHGQPIVIVFSENEWNPARVEQITALTSPLLSTILFSTVRPEVGESSLSHALYTIEREGTTLCVAL